MLTFRERYAGLVHIIHVGYPGKVDGTVDLEPTLCTVALTPDEEDPPLLSGAVEAGLVPTCLRCVAVAMRG